MAGKTVIGKPVDRSTIEDFVPRSTRRAVGSIEPAVMTETIQTVFVVTALLGLVSLLLPLAERLVDPVRGVARRGRRRDRRRRQSPVRIPRRGALSAMS